MIKLISSSRIARSVLVLVLTFVTVGLWSFTTQAADRTEYVQHIAGRAYQCVRESGFTTTRDGSHVYRSAYVCVEIRNSGKVAAR